MKDIIIIGAGAAGLTAAIHAAGPQSRVRVLEHTSRAASKILMTGNGKCNLSNENLSSEFYNCPVPGFVDAVLKQFDLEKTLKFFESAGVITTVKRGGIYPRSGQASSVNNALRNRCRQLNIEILCDVHTEKISALDPGFEILTDKGRYQCDALILACGGRSYPKTGSDGSGYKLASGLGHKITNTFSALTSLRVRGKYFKKLAGVRTAARVSIYADNVLLAGDAGELQLTDYGISGIPVFQVSRHAAKALLCRKQVTAVIDWLDEYTKEQALQLLEQFQTFNPEARVLDWFGALFHMKLAEVLYEELVGKTSDGLLIKNLTQHDKQQIIEGLKGFVMDVTEPSAIETAQVTAGGVQLKDIDPATMQSKKVKGLYFAGEMLDVDAICGGYNLQWAWSSGAIAGKNAAL